MRILRFIDSHGRERLGRLLDPTLDPGRWRPGEGRALLLEGDLFSGLEERGEVASVERLLAPVVPPAIFGIGLNYREHARETRQEIPERPVVFMKNPASLQDPGGPVVLPACSLKGPETDWEVELAVVLGRRVKDVDPATALEAVLGYAVGIDVSARRWQKHAGGGQWVRGKSFDTFCPLGPVLVTPQDVSEPQTLPLKLVLNGETMQESNTSDMIFPVARLIAELSQDTTLLAGTVILTGTPSGVGFARTPPRFLLPGDVMEASIGGIGTLICPVIQAPLPS